MECVLCIPLCTRRASTSCVYLYVVYKNLGKKFKSLDLSTAHLETKITVLKFKQTNQKNGPSRQQSHIII